MSATVGLWEHFRRLLDLNGREDRASFWPYAALVYGMMIVASFAAMMPVMQSAMSAASQMTTEDGAAFPAMRLFFYGIIAITAVAVLLYAAAVVRRLHDAGFSAGWALMPLPFLLFGIIRMRAFFGSLASGEPDMRQFNQIFFNNMIYILTLIALIILLARRSDPHPNRYDQNASSTKN